MSRVASGFKKVLGWGVSFCSVLSHLNLLLISNQKMVFTTFYLIPERVDWRNCRPRGCLSPALARTARPGPVLPACHRAARGGICCLPVSVGLSPSTTEESLFLHFLCRQHGEFEWMRRWLSPCRVPHSDGWRERRPLALYFGTRCWDVQLRLSLVRRWNSRKVSHCF